jgi:hypothetical protein
LVSIDWAHGKAIPTGLTIGPDTSEIDTRPSNGAAAGISIANLRPAATVDPHVLESGHPGYGNFCRLLYVCSLWDTKRGPCPSWEISYPFRTLAAARASHK